MNDTPEHGLPTEVLQLNWADQLRDIEQASSWDELGTLLHHSVGWIVALMLAEVIDTPTFEAMRDARNKAHKSATDRLIGHAQ